MRLGAPLFQSFDDPEQWAGAVHAAGYSAAFCPVGADQDEQTVLAYAEAAARHDIVIAEVGAWSNPISPDETVRKEALAKCKAGLALADRIGARCCVNIAGSRGEKWAGPYPDNLSRETFDLIVESVREIIDDVRPTRSFYTLETMPWIFPDSADSYVRLLRAIDRKSLAVHFDPVNLLNSPERYFRNGDLVRECIRKLGPGIRSCHAKDIIISDKALVHLDEVRPGDGALNYSVYLQELDRLDPDIPLMIEHQTTESDYVTAADYIRSVAEEALVQLR